MKCTTSHRERDLHHHDHPHPPEDHPTPARRRCVRLVPIEAAGRLAHVIRVYTARCGNRIVEIRCPWCDSTHTHGWPLDSTGAPGWRRPHCAHDKADYFIPEPPEGLQ